jgi:hypothetical protein
VAGSIRPRPDKGPDAFELRVFIGRDANGRPKQISRLFRGSRRAAEVELAQLVVRQIESPINPVAAAWDSSTTINDAIAGWG